MQLTHTPAEYDVKYESIQFSSAVDHVPLVGWYIDTPGTSAIMILHGKDRTRESDDAMPIAQSLARSDYDVLMFDFRAHGESGGERYTLGYLETRDVAGAITYLKSRGVNQIGAIGFSMGGVAALNNVPDQPELRPIVSDSAFADARSIVEKKLPEASGLQVYFNEGVILVGRFLYGLDIDNNQPAKSITRTADHRPIPLIHGTEDALVPVEHAYALQSAGAENPNLELWIVAGAGHTGAYGKNREEYMARVLGFFERTLIKFH